MEIPLLKDLVVIFGLALVVVFVCHRLKIPTIVGLLLTGAIAGPHGLSVVAEVHDVEVMAEIGVALLLFTIGIEFSLAGLARSKTAVFVGGGLQVGVTMLIGAGIAVAFSHPPGTAMFYGFLLALSSTAIVLKVLQERAEVDAPHGRSVLGALIFQDIVAVPMMLMIPAFAGSGGGALAELSLLLIKAAVVVGLTFILARWLIPRLLYQAARLKDREMFLLAVIVIGLGIAWLTSLAGLSLALGAFLAGLIISESEYSRQALGDIMPFRDVFTSLFFISVGMLLDVGTLGAMAGPVALALLAVILIKSLIGTAAALGFGMPLRVAAITGLSIAQIGEFSFILALVGKDAGLIGDSDYQLFLAVAVSSMIAAPFLIRASGPVADFLLKLPLPAPIKNGFRPPPEHLDERYKDHLVIVGFGPGGRSLAMAAKTASIPYVVIEMNAETVRKERELGEPIFFGDAAHAEVLSAAAVETARVLVVAIPDPSATRRVVELARGMTPSLHIIARTPFIKETDPLFELGASEVIPAELETSIEIFTRVLNRYLTPRSEIERFIDTVRADHYDMFRSDSVDPSKFCDLPSYMPGIEVFSLQVEAGSEADGKTLADLELRKKLGATVMAIRRGNEVISNPEGSARLSAGDVVALMGGPESVPSTRDVFTAGTAGAFEEE